jgi:hypothetical protein
VPVSLINLNLNEAINLMKDLCNENYKSLKKEINDIRRWKDIHAHGTTKSIL